jgi:hypothetical protein
MMVSFFGKVLTEDQQALLKKKAFEWMKKNPDASSGSFKIEMDGQVATGTFGKARNLDVTVHLVTKIEKEEASTEPSTTDPTAFDRAVAQGIIVEKGPHIYLMEEDLQVDHVLGKNKFLEKYPQFK